MWNMSITATCREGVRNIANTHSTLANTVNDTDTAQYIISCTPC